MEDNYSKSMLENMNKLLENEKTKKKGGKAKKQLSLKHKGVSGEQEKNLNKISEMVVHLI